MWDKILEEEFNKKYYIKLKENLNEIRKIDTVYPKEEDVFNAFKFTKFENIKVVILGQDPYHQKGQAHGLAFSSLDDKVPKSLQNIKKELESDLNIKLSGSSNLTTWAEQGVLLLNTILTVSEGKPLSHKNIGWEIFTLNIFKKVCAIDKPIVFILWGNHAKSYKKYITNQKHLIIESPHPSPLSSYRGFFGSRPFSKTNNFLQNNKIRPINFKI